MLSKNWMIPLYIVLGISGIPLAWSSNQRVYADAHFHPSNYAMQGFSLKELVQNYMGDSVKRSTIMPIALQQRWDGFEPYGDGTLTPNTWIGSKADLYYYSFVDAIIATEYKRLSVDEQQRLDPMITGFNPMDKNAVQHIKRVLLTYPGVFSGIGEFSLHKEVVSQKIAGKPLKEIISEHLPEDLDEAGTITLYSPAIQDILNFTAETGLIAVLHNDIYASEISYTGKINALLPDHLYIHGLIYICKKSPHANVIWAHTGLGKFIVPTKKHLQHVATVLDACPNWFVDLSWNVIQRYMVSETHTQEVPSIHEWAAFITRYQNRVLWGSDSVGFKKNSVHDNGEIQKGHRLSVEEYKAALPILNPLFKQIDSSVAEKVRQGNYIRIFNAARAKVRTWEATHASMSIWD
jgi:hypothetical protein